MGKHDTPVDFDVGALKLRLTAAQLLALIAAVVSVVAAAVTFAVNAATKAELVAAIAAHDARPHTPTEGRLRGLESTDAEQDARLAQLEGIPDEMRAVRARVDLLVYEAQSTPQRSGRTARAAARVRNEARERGESADPLGGL